MTGSVSSGAHSDSYTGAGTGSDTDGGKSSRSHFCQLCGQRITGQSKVFHHERWPRNMVLRVCADCERDKPRCRVCALPMAAPTPNNVCATCSAQPISARSQVSRFCLACGEAVGKRYYEFDGVGPYCQDCQRKRSPCDVCAAPLTNEHWQLSDGRVMCVYCHNTAIYAAANAAALYEEMKTVVARLLNLTLNIPTGLALVDRNQLAEVIRQQQDLLARPDENASLQGGANSETTGEGQAPPLDPQRTLGIYTRRGMRRGIYVQTGLPRLLFLQVAAHEYAHAWQGENCPLLREGPEHEGFAEWVAYQVLGHYGYERGQEHMCARQDIYGQGLKWALELESRRGVAGVIEICRTLRHSPGPV